MNQKTKLFFNKIKNISTKIKLLVVFFLLHISLFLTVIFYPTINISLKYFIFLTSIVIPILMGILIVFDSKKFIKLKKYNWFKFLLYVISIIFIIYSNQYASEEINKIFKVSSSNLPITTIVLTHIYAIKLFTEALIYISILILPLVLVFSLIYTISEPKYLLKLFVPLLLSGFYVAFIQAPHNLIFKYQETIIKEIAYKFDFNKQYYCKEFNNVDSVLFVNNKVLVKYQIPVENKEFEVKECRL